MIELPLTGRSRYVFALLTAAAGVASLILFPDFFQRSPLTPAWCVSLISLLVAGVVPAILAEIIIISATMAFAISPEQTFGFEVPGDGARVAIWLGCIGLADYLAWRLQSARRLSALREKALGESEARYRDLLEQASDGIVLTDPDGRMLLVNQRAADMLGYREEELRRLQLADLFAPGEPDLLTAGWDELSKRPVVLQERRLRRKDHSTFEAELSLRRTGRGLLQGIIRDITERREAEEARLGAQKALARVTASVPGVVYQYVVGPDGKERFAYVSERASELFGVPPQEILENPGRFLAVVEPEDIQAAGPIFRRATRNLEPYTFDFRIRAEGSAVGTGQRRLRAIATPSREGDLVVWHGVIVDITEQTRLQEELLQAQKMESLGRLAGGVAHDFNNLLTVIGGYADVLAGQLGAEDPRLEEVREIRHAADRATSLTRQLLAVSRRQMLVFREVDLNGLVAEMDRMLRRVLGANIRVVTDTAPNLGFVRADPGQLEQVLLNLAVNARDAMRSGGGGTLTIETRRHQVTAGRLDATTRGLPPGDYVLLRVSDTGEGMDLGTQAKVFEPFFTTKALGEGTGLGLSTVYGIVQQSKGIITVESTPGKGTSFRVFLPRVAEPRPAPDESSPDPRAGQGRTKGTVLVVEDDEGVRRLTGRILEQYGFGVVEAEDGKQALEMLAQSGTRVDALVSDIVMPGMSGPDLVGKVRRRLPHLPVLLLSGFTGNEAMESGPTVSVGRQAFLQKPFSPDALAAALEELLADSR